MEPELFWSAQHLSTIHGMCFDVNCLIVLCSTSVWKQLFFQVVPSTGLLFNISFGYVYYKTETWSILWILNAKVLLRFCQKNNQNASNWHVCPMYYSSDLWENCCLLPDFVRNDATFLFLLTALLLRQFLCAVLWSDCKSLVFFKHG